MTGSDSLFLHLLKNGNDLIRDLLHRLGRVLLRYGLRVSLWHRLLNALGIGLPGNHTRLLNRNGTGLIDGPGGPTGR